MSSRGSQLHQAAGRQTAELLELLSRADEAVLSRPCPGRERLGDGTIGATAQHITGVYQLLARFIQTQAAPHARPLGAAHHEPSPNHHHEPAPADPQQLLGQLSTATAALGALAELTDEQLASVPPEGSFRFSDGQRTLEQVIASVLRHQQHHIDALKAALASGTAATPRAE